jgi:hypothetical protein
VVTSVRAEVNLALALASAMVKLLLVVVRLAREERSEVVDVTRLARASVVSCWLSLAAALAVALVV